MTFCWPTRPSNRTSASGHAAPPRTGKATAPRAREAGPGPRRDPRPRSWRLPGPAPSPRMHLVENKIPRDWLRSQAIMAAPSGKGARAPEAPGCGPRPLARDLVDSVDDVEGLYVAVERCPLCNTTRRRLTCAKCVQNGDFVYFDGRDRERYGGRHGPIVSSPGGSSAPRWRLEPEAQVWSPDSRERRGSWGGELLGSQGTGSGSRWGKVAVSP